LLHRLFVERLGLTLAIAASIALAAEIGVYALALAQADNLKTPQGPLIGGDFIVFWTAGLEALRGGATAMYDPQSFQAALATAFPQAPSYRVTWQYPPTMLAALAPFAGAPYLVAFAGWALIGLTLFLIAARTLNPDPRALYFLVASPAMFHGAATGQTGFFTALCLLGAAFDPKRRWLVAGLAAGALTLKPQLGLLVPIAFAAAGCWRAFAVAAATALVLAGLAQAAYGAAVWPAFVEAAIGHGREMDDAGFPTEKLVTPFGAALQLGLDRGLAAVVQLLATVVLAVAVFLIWRRTEDRALRVASLLAAAPLATPYAFYYEAPVIALAIFALGTSAIGADRRFAYACAALFAASMLAPGKGDALAPLAFLCAAGAAALVAAAAARDGSLPLSLTRRQG
jgi:hypothetical protein